MVIALKHAPAGTSAYESSTKSITMTFGELVEVVCGMTDDPYLAASLIERMINNRMIYVKKKNLRWV